MANFAELSPDTRPARHPLRILRVIGESFLWGALMTAAAYFSLMSEQARVFGPRVMTILALYFAGGAIGYLFAFPVVRWLKKRISPRQRLIIAILLLGGFTLAATAGVLALNYRTYYAEWHEAAYSIHWVYQQIFTVLGSTYQYLVIGIRLYWPLGPAFLLIAGWWMTRRAS